MEVFRRQQQDQLEKNRKLREEQLQREQALDNVPPSGTDLMHQLYKDKVHVSYERRAKADKILALMQG